MEEEKEKLVPTSKLIDLARERGIDFGKGNPNERLRYYTKIGLLPHAQRKVDPADSRKTVGHYPLWVLDRLQTIEKLRSQGFSAREARERLKTKEPGAVPQEVVKNLTEPLVSSIEDLSEKIESAQGEKKGEFFRFAGKLFLVFLLALALFAVAIFFVPKIFLPVIEPIQDELRKITEKIQFPPIQTEPKPPLEEVPGLSEEDIGNIENLGLADGRFDLTAQNVIRNSSFEANGSGSPRLWTYYNESTSDNTFITQEGVHTGGNGLKLKGSAGSPYLGIYQPEVKTDWTKPYSLSAWVKVLNAPKITVKLGFWDKPNNKRVETKEFTLQETKDWQRLSLSADNRGTYIGKDWLPLIEVYGLTSGSVYIDDVQLEESAGPTLYHALNGAILGDGSISTDASGNLYPTQDAIGDLGKSGGRFRKLQLFKASINEEGTLDLSGSASVAGSISAGSVNSHLIPNATNTYDLGSTSRYWNNLYVTNFTGGSSFNCTDCIDFDDIADAMTLDGNLTISASASNYSINIDSGNLFVDTANNRVGIGTATPTVALDVTGAVLISSTLGVTGDTTLTGDLAVNGDDITSDGDLTITASGGNILTSNALNVGGATAQAYNFFADSTATAGSVAGDNDLYVEDVLEVDGSLVLNSSTFNCTDCIDFDDLADAMTIDSATTIAYTGAGTSLALTNSGAKTAASTGFSIANTSTSSTASINKYALQLSSTGTWNGTSAYAIGLEIQPVTGGTNNVALCFDCDGTWDSSTVASGIQFGTDANSVNLYRVADNVLATDDDFRIIGNDIQDSGGTNRITLATSGTNIALTGATTVSSTLGVTGLLTATGGIKTDTISERTASARVSFPDGIKTHQIYPTVTNLRVGDITFSGSDLREEVSGNQNVLSVYGTFSGRMSFLSHIAIPNTAPFGFAGDATNNALFIWETSVGGAKSVVVSIPANKVLALDSSLRLTATKAIQDSGGTDRFTPGATNAITGDATISGTLGVTGLATLTGGFNAGAASTVNGFLRVGSAVAPTVALDVTGAALISSTLGVTGDTTLTGDLAVNGDDITSDGDLTITAAGGNIITGNALNVGGAAAQAYNFFADSTATAGSVAGDNDLYVEDVLEVDGSLVLNSSTFNCTDCIDFDDLVDAMTIDAATTIAYTGAGTSLALTNSGAKTAASTGFSIANTSTSSTASINKYALQLSSTGTWDGTSAYAIGLEIQPVTGGTNNVALCFDCDGTWSSSTVASGIQFGTDANSVNLYRVADDTLATDDNFRFANSSFQNIQDSGGTNRITLATSGTNIALTGATTVSSTLGVTGLLTATGGIATDTISEKTAGARVYFPNGIKTHRIDPPVSDIWVGDITFSGSSLRERVSGNLQSISIYDAFAGGMTFFAGAFNFDNILAQRSTFTTGAGIFSFNAHLRLAAGKVIQDSTAIARYTPSPSSPHNTLTGDAAVTANLRVGSAVAPTVALDVTGAALISSTLGVTGNTTLTGDLAVNGGDITTTATTWNFDLPSSGGTIYFRDGTNTLCSIADAGTTGNLTCTGNITGSSSGTVGFWSRNDTTDTLSPATTGDVIDLGTIQGGDTGFSTTLPNLLGASATGISVTYGSSTTSGTATGVSLTIGSAGAGTTQNGLLITPPSSTGAGATNGINIGAITTSNGTDTAINIGSGWDTDLAFVDTTPTVTIGDTGTLSITDGTNTLCSIADAGTTGNLSCTGNATFSGTTITATNVTSFNCTDCIDFDDLEDTLDIDATTTINTTATTTTPLSYLADSLTTGTGLEFSVDALTTGKGLSLTSTSNSYTTGSILSASLTQSAATGTSVSGDIGAISFSPIYSTAVTTPAISGNVLDISRSTTTNSLFASTLTVSGAVLAISDTSTQTTGTLTNTANVLSLTQSYASASGDVLSISNAGTGAGISLAGAGTRSINSTSGDLTISTTTSGTLALTSAGALNLTGAAASTWDIGANTLSLQTTNNGAITTGTGLLTLGGDIRINGGDIADPGGTNRITLATASPNIAITGNVLIDGATAADVQLTVQGAASQSTNIFVVETSAGTDKLFVDSDGDTLIRGHTAMGASGSINASVVLNLVELAADANLVGASINPANISSSGLSRNTTGLAGIAEWRGSGTATGNFLRGLDFVARHNSSRSLTTMIAINASLESLVAGTGALTTATGIELETPSWAGDVPTNIYGINVPNMGNASVAELRIIRILNQTAAVTTTRLISQEGTTGVNVLAAPTTIGADAAPTSGIELDVTGDIAASGNLVVGANSAATADSIEILNATSTKGLRVQSDVNNDTLRLLIADTATAGAADAEISVSDGDLTLSPNTGVINLSGSATTINVGDSGSPTTLTIQNPNTSVANVTVEGVVTATFNAANSAALCWDNAGSSEITDCTGGPSADLAEWVSTDGTPQPGDVVKVLEVKRAEGQEVSESDTWVTQSNVPYEAGLIGIIATAPELVMSDPNIKTNPQPVALSGLVPVKVSTENGPIKAGDSLTSSSTPGVAMRATKAGRVIGMALESFACAQDSSQTEETVNSEPITQNQPCLGKILVFVNVSYYVGDLNELGLLLLEEPQEEPPLEQSATESAKLENNLEEATPSAQTATSSSNLNTATHSASSGQASASPTFKDALVSQIIKVLKSFGITVKDAIVTIKDAVIEKLTLKEFTIDNKDNPEPILGEAKIAAGEKEVKIQNSKIKENSKIFVTFRGKPQEFGHAVKEIKEGEYFIIEISRTLSEDLIFDYWIVQTTAPVQLKTEYSQTQTPSPADGSTSGSASPSEPQATQQTPTPNPTSEPTETPQPTQEATGSATQ